jgi:hypothetical protein
MLSAAMAILLVPYRYAFIWVYPTTYAYRHNLDLLLPDMPS